MNINDLASSIKLVHLQLDNHMHCVLSKSLMAWRLVMVCRARNFERVVESYLQLRSTVHDWPCLVERWNIFRASERPIASTTCVIEESLSRFVFWSVVHRRCACSESQGTFLMAGGNNDGRVPGVLEEPSVIFEITMYVPSDGSSQVGGQVKQTSIKRKGKPSKVSTERIVTEA